MLPTGQSAVALCRVPVDPSVGPLAQRRLDEALGFAVGLRPVSAGELVAEIQFGACVGEVLGSERRAVVGQHTAYSHAQAGVVAHGLSEELHRLRRLLVRVHGREGDACMVVHRDEQHLPAGTVDRVAPVACHAVAWSFDATELLGVDVQQITGPLVLVAHHRLGRLQICWP